MTLASLFSSYGSAMEPSTVISAFPQLSPTICSLPNPRAHTSIERFEIVFLMLWLGAPGEPSVHDTLRGTETKTKRHWAEGLCHLVLLLVGFVLNSAALASP